MKIEDIVERLHEIAAELPLTDAIVIRDAANKLRQEWLDQPTPPAEREEKKEPTKVQRLAEDHWNYVKGILEPARFGFNRMTSYEILEYIGHHYKEAAIHFYGHGYEDAMSDIEAEISAGPNKHHTPQRISETPQIYGPIKREYEPLDPDHVKIKETRFQINKKGDPYP